jgi:chitodextrinase
VGLLVAAACGKEEPLAPGTGVLQHGISASSGGRTGANGGASCKSCHGDATGAVLTITGPTTVNAGATNQYTATITGGPAVVGGADVHVSSGTLASLTGQGTKLLNGDLVHSSPKPFASGSVSWNFNWTAPATAGTVSMFGAGNSADGDGSDAGDAGDGATTRTITVQAAATNQPPVANAGPDQSVNDADGNGTQQVTLDGSASTDDGSILAWTWKEGGQTIASGQKPTFNLAVGQHTISLTVADNGSPALTATDNVVVTVTPMAVVNQPPVANAGPDQTVNDADASGSEQVTLDGSGSTDDGSIATYTWKEGGQTIASGQKPAVSLAVGQHTISLTVADNGSPSLTASDNLVITVTAGATSNQPLVANAGGPYTGTMNRPVRFDGRGSSPAGSIAAYLWDFGDGQTGAGPTPKHRYGCTGTFTVGLVVTDNLGAQSTDVTQVLVGGRGPATTETRASREEERAATTNRCQPALSTREGD